MNREDVHRKKKVLYFGQEGVGNVIRVSVPIEENGQIVWQRD